MIHPSTPEPPMSDDPQDSQNKEDLNQEIERVCDRFWSLSTEGSVESEGFAQVAVGLNAILEDVRDSGVDTSRVMLLVNGLDALADLLVDTRPDRPASGLSQFIDRFRIDAQKRMAGLSISIMGIFNEQADNQAAITQSAQHLHAIRGAAAMLNLTPIAQLSGALEDLVLALRRQDTPPSTWPVKPILRGFAVLKSAVESPEEKLDVLVEELVAEMRKQIATLGKDIANEFKREDTSVKTRSLEQRILVVDDVDTVAASVGFILAELDIPVDIAVDGQDALDRLRSTAYSLVISDVDMPRVGGFELVRKIRADENLQEIPVILLTQLDTEAERARGMKAGADDYIVKGSIGGGELVARVNELLVEAPFVPTVEDDAPRRKILIAEDTETVAASIAFVLSEGPYEIVLAHDGKDAIHKLDQDDFDLVISDVEMPSMNGFELVTAMKAEADFAAIPFVMLTSRDSDEDRERAREAGAARYLLKGEVPADELLSIVGELLKDE